MLDAIAALRACAAELERLRYAQPDCPSCRARVHHANCPLVKALALARNVLDPSTTA